MTHIWMLILCFFATNTLGAAPNNFGDTKPHSKYRNIVFDLGNVLIFSSLKDEIFKLYSLAGASAEQKVIIDNLLLDYNREKLNEEQFAYQIVYTLFPNKGADMYEHTLRIIRENIQGLVVSKEAFDLLQVFKSKGYKVYILSNLPLIAYEVIGKIPGFFEKFDGGVFSYEAKCVKPEPEIYKMLLTRYSLNPEECLFIDDLEVNIEAGKACGIDGVIYCDHLQAVEELKRLKVL